MASRTAGMETLSPSNPLPVTTRARNPLSSKDRLRVGRGPELSSEPYYEPYYPGLGYWVEQTRLMLPIDGINTSNRLQLIVDVHDFNDE